MLDTPKILKAGQTGHGILIEHDAGFIDPTDTRNKPFITEMTKSFDGKTVVPDPFILYAILQKYDVENRNGRIYPEALLRRQAKRYQLLIDQKSALGECVPKGTGIYTKNGWRNIEDVKVGDEVFTLNIETNKLELQQVTATINKDYNDDMIRIYNDSTLDMLVTKKHKIVLWDRNDKPYVLTAEELHDRILSKDLIVLTSYIKNAGDWTGDNITELENITNNNLSKISLSDISLITEKVSFNDKVFCVTVPNKTWLMRYNNKISWTHNCDHPEASVISIDRTSINITEIWWEGKTLMGKIQILTSPGFVNNGIISCEGDKVANLLRLGCMIGVSSRGIGSLKKVNGKDIVQDDFELICWDVVTSPSTPGSWIVPSREAAKPFTEAYNKQKSALNENLDKFLLL